MKKKVESRRLAVICILGGVLLLAAGLQAQEGGKPLVLQEMSWTDVRDYLKTSDMVIIPMGSTEQHGQHLPLGTDTYEAEGLSKMISSRTGVVVAPVVLAGYSVYHSGFQGTLSLKPGTMEQVLFETAELLVKYGFRRFMFFNFHGGNERIVHNVIHRINHSTEAVAAAIGIEAPFQKVPLDGHAGVGETSLMLFFHPDLVHMERAEKPVVRLSPRAQKLQEAAKKDPALSAVFEALMAVPEETKKGGASHEITNTGAWTESDPAKATAEIGKRIASQMVENAVKFIKAWREAEK